MKGTDTLFRKRGRNCSVNSNVKIVDDKRIILIVDDSLGDHLVGNTSLKVFLNPA